MREKANQIRHPDQFEITLHIPRPVWNSRNTPDQMISVNSDGVICYATSSIGLMVGKGESAQLSREQISKLGELIIDIEPKWTESGLLGDDARDAQGHTIDLVWGKVRRRYESRLNWGDLDDEFEALIKFVKGCAKSIWSEVV
ncbi:MAG: hypothetical protein EP319_11910 [Deltaproteobacteria bacterium]|nr:MAG: hypothetical protein EP319_11910 [Deltaproteobacteria bacterium]